MLSKDRKLLMKKAWKFRRLKKTQPLTQAWKWVYIKKGKTILSLFKFSINSEIEHIENKEFNLEYLFYKESGKYVLIFWDLKKRSDNNRISFTFKSRSSIPHALGILYFQTLKKNSSKTNIIEL